MDGFKDFFSTLLNVSLFGWLDKIPLWQNLPYQWKGGILRGLKAALSYILGILVTLPLTGFNPVIAVIIAAVIQGADKAVREWKIDQDASANNADVSTSGQVNTDATVVTPDPKTGDPVVNTDATTVDGVPTDPAAVPIDNADPTVFDDPVDTP